MGTNYYIRSKACEHCGHAPEPIHLGKSSGGWKFHLQANDFRDYHDWPSMKAWLTGKEIVDEYDRPVPVREFIELVMMKQRADEPLDSRTGRPYLDGYDDGSTMIDGYIFFNHWFS